MSFTVVCLYKGSTVLVTGRLRAENWKHLANNINDSCSPFLFPWGAQEIMRRGLFHLGLDFQGSLGDWGRQYGEWEMVRLRQKPKIWDWAHRVEVGSPRWQRGVLQLSGHAHSWAVPGGWVWTVDNSIPDHPLLVGDWGSAYSFLQPWLVAGPLGLAEEAHQKMYVGRNQNGKSWGWEAGADIWLLSPSNLEKYIYFIFKDCHCKS